MTPPIPLTLWCLFRHRVGARLFRHREQAHLVGVQTVDDGVSIRVGLICEDHQLKVLQEQSKQGLAHGAQIQASVCRAYNCSEPAELVSQAPLCG